MFRVINVTKTFLPDYQLYSSYLKRAWDAVWLTNRGELTLELEAKIKKKYKNKKKNKNSTQDETQKKNDSVNSEVK